MRRIGTVSGRRESGGPTQSQSPGTQGTQGTSLSFVKALQFSRNRGDEGNGDDDDDDGQAAKKRAKVTPAQRAVVAAE